MRVFIVSKNGESLPLAEKLQKEKHDVILYVRNKYYECPNKDIKLTKNPTAEMMTSELIVVEDNKSAEFVERAKKLNRPILGGGVVANRLEHDSRFGTDALIGCGFNLAKENTKGMFIEVGGWFTRGEFLKPYFISWKHMEFGSGGIGPEIGPMGAIGVYRLKGKLFRETIEKTKTLLKSVGYVGYIGLEMFVNNDRINMVGWKPGLTFPVVSLLTDIHNHFGVFLFKVAVETAKVVSVQPDKVVAGVTWLKLPWLYENPIKHRPNMICESGICVDEAISKAYTTIHKTLESDEYYRNDIGHNYADNVKKLKDGGWL